MQWSLQGMMMAMFGLAFLCALLFSIPSWLALLVIYIGHLLLPAVLVTGIAYGSDAQRCFAIGAAATFGSYAILTRRTFLSGSSFRASLVELLILSIVIVSAGYVSLWFRRWLLTARPLQKWSVTPPASPPVHDPEE